MIEADDFTSILMPLEITDAAINTLTANGVALGEDTNPAWASGTTYTEGQVVHSPVTHRVYESLKSANTGKDPTKASNQFSAAGVPTWWVDIGPTNRRAMFDGLISTPTSGASPLVLKLRPGAFNGIALFGLDGDTIAVEARATPGGEVLYTTGGDVPLEGSAPADYYEYFFEPFKPQTQFTAVGIQPYSSAELTITVKKGTGDAKIGMVAVGDLKPIGVPERGTRVSPRTKSYISEDGYGNTVIRRRPSATDLAIPVKVALEDADDIVQTIQNVLDVPVAVIGSIAQFHLKMSTFGLVSGEMDYSTYPDRTLNLTVKGFI